MRLIIRLSFLSLLLLASFTGSYAQAQPQADLSATLEEACAVAKQLPNLAPAVCHPGSFDRRPIVGDIYEYSFNLSVGTGEHDVIRLHRVVREDASGLPHKAKHAVFMVHGDIWGFDGAFLGSTLSENVPREQSIGIYLADKGVDVWGIDLRWVQVPAETVDFTFMKDWNIGTHVRDIATGISVARVVRGVTGSGSGKVALLGWSRGGIIAYAYANEETRLPEQLRQVNALIPVDIFFKLNSEHEAQRLGACQRYSNNKQLLDAGQYSSNLGTLVDALGLLASTNPQAPSPIPGFVSLTNGQAALLLTTSTHLLFAPNPPVPFYHFNAGEFSALGLPTGLRFTRKPYLYDFLQMGAPFQSFTEQVESEAIICGEIENPYDDYLADIEVPVLYVGAEGGFGKYGIDTLSRLVNAEVSSHVVQLYGPESRAVEFGHADLFLADNARDLVWTPVYNWLTKH